MADAPPPPDGFVVEGAAPPPPPDGFQIEGSPEPSTPPSAPTPGGSGVGRGLIEGASSILGMPADVWHMLDRGYQNALTYGAQKIGLLSPEDAQNLRAPMKDATGADMESSNLDSQHIASHLLNLAAATGANTNAPQTTAGKVAETVTSFLPGAAMMGEGAAPAVARDVLAGTGASAPTGLRGWALGRTALPDVSAANAETFAAPASAKAALKYGVIPGATSEAAGEATEGTPLEPYARAVGAVTPLALTSGVGAARTLMNPIRRSLAGVQPGQFTAAQDLLDQSRAARSPLTTAEALQQTTGSATPLGDIQRVVEQSPKGGAIMKPFFAQRPDQTEALGRTALDQVAPSGMDPYENAPKVQESAAGNLSAADRARSAAVKPLYQSAATDQVPAADMSAFLDKIDGMIGQDKTGLLSPQLVKLRDALTEAPAVPATATTAAQPRIPITDIENLDTARKYFRDQITQPAIAQDAIPKQVGARMGSLLDELRGMMVGNSTDFAAAKQKYADITQNTVAPLQRSPTGQLAEAETFPKQAQILFNPNPLPGSQYAVGKAVRDIAATDPDAAQALVRAHLEKMFNEATQDNLPGGNQFGGPKFVAVVSGNSQQARNLRAIVQALPDGNTRWNALRKSMDIMQAMGTRQPVGSQTAFNAQIMDFLKQGHPAAEALATAASPGRWITMVHDLYQKLAYGQNTAALAKVFTQGNIADLRAIVAPQPTSLRAQAALVGALVRQGAMAGQSATQPPP